MGKRITFVESHPYLRALWAKENDIPFEKAKSHGKNLWLCPECHKIDRNLNVNNAAGSICLDCRKKKGLYNDMHARLAIEEMPELIDYWNDKNAESLNTVKANPKQPMKYWWVCPQGHEWMEDAGKIIGRSYVCPYCANKRLLPGFNDLATVEPVVASLWSPLNTITSSDVRTISIGSYKWVCPSDPSHRFSSTIPNMVNRVHRALKHVPNGCPKCAREDAKKNHVSKGSRMLAKEKPELESMFDPALNPGVKFSEINSYSSKLIRWTCRKDHCHTFYVTPVNMTISYKCPYCSHRKLMAGQNDLATTNPDIASMLDDSLNDFSASQVTDKDKRIAVWTCPNHPDAHWSKPVRDQVLHPGCPYCDDKMLLSDKSNSLAAMHPEILKEWDTEKNGDPYALTESPYYATDAYWRCSTCGGSWKIRPRYYVEYLHNHGHTHCPYCNGKELLVGFNDLATMRPDLIPMWSDKNDKGPSDYRFNSKEEVWWKCPIGHHREWRDSVRNETRGGYSAGCYVCKNKVYSMGENDLVTLQPDLAKEWAYDLNETRPEDHMINDGSQVIWRCLKGHVWKCSITGRAFDHDGSCPRCASGLHTSKPETDITDYLRSILGDDEIIVNNDKTVLPREHMVGSNSELDIYLPDRNLAIEYNGLHWHSALIDSESNRIRHVKKYEACKSMGIRLVQIWEDQWLDHPDIIKDSLRAILTPKSMVRENARSLHVEKPDRVYAKKFFDENHIQGNAGACTYLALVDNHHVIHACVAYRIDGDELNLVRYASLLGHIVRGGMSRLIRHAISDARGRGPTVKRVITFSDNTISEGASYAKIGFHLDAEIPPDYAYVNDKHRYHKFLYRRKRFRDDPLLAYSPTAHESELASMNGLARVYDAGKKRWVMTP